MNDITPEKVAAVLSNGTDAGWRWDLEARLSLTVQGNVLRLETTRWEDDEEGTENVRHFCAVVVEGEQAPIVLERPTTLERTWGPMDDIRSWVSPDCFVCVKPHTLSVAYLTPQQARREAARLAALADEAEKQAGEEIARRRAEAAQAEQERGEAADHG